MTSIYRDYNCIFGETPDTFQLELFAPSDGKDK